MVIKSKETLESLRINLMITAKWELLFLKHL